MITHMLNLLKIQALYSYCIFGLYLPKQGTRYVIHMYECSSVVVIFFKWPLAKKWATFVHATLVTSKNSKLFASTSNTVPTKVWSKKKFTPIQLMIQTAYFFQKKTIFLFHLTNFDYKRLSKPLFLTFTIFGGILSNIIMIISMSIS